MPPRPVRCESSCTTVPRSCVSASFQGLPDLSVEAGFKGNSHSLSGWPSRTQSQNPGQVGASLTPCALYPRATAPRQASREPTGEPTTRPCLRIALLAPRTCPGPLTLRLEPQPWVPSTPARLGSRLLWAGLSSTCPGRGKGHSPSPPFPAQSGGKNICGKNILGQATGKRKPCYVMGPQACLRSREHDG